MVRIYVVALALCWRTIPRAAAALEAAAAAEPQQQQPPELRLTVFAHRDRALLRIGEVPRKHLMAGPTAGADRGGAVAWEASCRIVPAAGGAPIWEGNASGSGSGGGAPAGSAGPAAPLPPLVGLSLTAIPSSAPSVWGLAPGQQPLYNASCTVSRAGGWREGVHARFGFRDFEAKDGQFLLNGAPIFLRGWSINPPGRGLPAAASNRSFAEGYLRWMKERAGVNAVRIGDGASKGDTGNHHWYDVCDEIGMLIYAGPYGGVQCPDCKGMAPAAELASSVSRYQSVLMDETASHPSHVILILSNEVGLDNTPSWQSGKSADKKFLKNVSIALSVWDDTRAYLGDAGFGLGRGGQVNDDHTYYGWYIGDANSYYLHGQNHSLLTGEALPGSQPQTFTECVGNYLTAGGDFDVSGKNWAWSLKWGGTSQGFHAADEHAAYVAKLSIEIVRRRRRLNPSLAGIMPFHSPFYYCGDGVETFGDIAMHPSPVLVQQATSFAPVLLSIECWTPHAVSGDHVPVTFHVVNDKADSTPVPASTLEWSWVDEKDGREIQPAVGAAQQQPQRWPVPEVEYYGTAQVQLNITAPAASALGTGQRFSNMKLVARLTDNGGSTAIIGSSSESVTVFRPAAAAPALAAERRTADGAVAVFDPHGATAAALTQLGLDFKPVSSLAKLTATTTPSLIIGEDSWTGAAMATGVSSYVASGGRVAILQQSDAAVAFDPRFLDPGLVSYDMQDKVGHSGRNVSNGEPVHVQRPAHPLFTAPHNISDLKLWRRWSLRAPWTETAVDNGPLPDNSPAASGVRWNISDADISRDGTPSAADVAAQWEVNAATSRRTSTLVSHSRGQTNQVLVEIFSGGKAGGSALLVGLGLAQRSAAEPVADLFMENLLHYLSDRSQLVPPHPFFEPGHTITWGDYASERGVAFSNPAGAAAVHTVTSSPPATMIGLTFGHVCLSRSLSCSLA